MQVEWRSFGSSLGLCVAMVVLLSSALAANEDLTPQTVIQKSIAYHDPQGAWDTGKMQLQIHTVYSEDYAVKAGNTEIDLELLLSPHNQMFRYVKKTGDDTIEISVDKDVPMLKVNGSDQVSGADRERLRIGEPLMYRNYCEYLYGMPMKLRDPGTHVDPALERTSFEGQDVLQVKVTYDPEVGTHTWYFYFDPSSFALVGYRFYFDESKNDGEYITFEGEVKDDATGMRLPQARAWYFNVDDAHLATDTITALTVTR